MKNIAAAFVKAQRAFGPALKTNTNPAFRSKYADLSACVEAVIDALHANGIALIQQTEPSDRGVKVRTVMLHESGEQMDAGWLEVPASKQDPQGYGSALTYARRYSLMAACGIAPEDDDGNAASKPAKKQAGEFGHFPSVSQTVAEQTKLSQEDLDLCRSYQRNMEEAWSAGRQLEALKVWDSITDNDIKVHMRAWASNDPEMLRFLKANSKQAKQASKAEA